MRLTTLKRVVLPAPFGPMRPQICPRSIVKERSSRATMPPNRTDTSETSSTGTSRSPKRCVTGGLAPVVGRTVASVRGPHEASSPPVTNLSFRQRLLEPEVRVRLIVERTHLDVASRPIQRDRFGQGSVGVEPYRPAPRRRRMVLERLEETATDA